MKDMEQAIIDKDFGTFAELTMKASLLCLQALCSEIFGFFEGFFDRYMFF